MGDLDSAFNHSALHLLRVMDIPLFVLCHVFVWFFWF